MFRYLALIIAGFLTFTSISRGDELCVPVLTEITNENGLTFQLCSASVIPTDQIPQNILPDNFFKTDGVLNIKLKAINQSVNRKIDVKLPLLFTLEDNFHNTYRLVGASQAVADTPMFAETSALQSLYPRDFFTQTLFFESPVASFDKLIFAVNSQSMNGKPLSLTMAIPKEMVILDKAAARAQEIDREIIKVSAPVDTSVKPGDIVSIEINLDKIADPPDNVLIISPDYVLEDTSNAGNYDIRIPLDRQPGPFPVLILAGWGEGAKDRSASAAVTFNVLDHSENCPRQTTEQAGF